VHVVHELACGFPQYNDADVIGACALLKEADLLDHLGGAAKKIAGNEPLQMFAFTQIRTHCERPSPMLTALQFLYC
jgi:hypothetical protein